MVTPDEKTLQFHGKWDLKDVLNMIPAHASHLATMHKILRAGYYWPTMFKDIESHIRSCHTCQTTIDKGRNQANPLQQVTESRPFAQWGLDFIGVINPPSSARHKFILIVTDYSTRWTEATCCKFSTTKVVISSLKKTS